MEKVRTKLKDIIGTFYPSQLPNFFIVGAQKAGTTALHHYLGQHPDILASRPKEVSFFSVDSNYDQGLNWYKKSFLKIDNPFKKYSSFEATPEYLYRKGVAKRIYDYKPESKIIIILREPVSRAFSAWNMYKFFGERERGIPKQFYKPYIVGLENNIYAELFARNSYPSFREAIYSDLDKWKKNSQLSEPSFFRRGIYLDQLKEYFKYFKKENVLILGFKDVIGVNKQKTLKIITRFLGLEEVDWQNLREERTNSIPYKDKIDLEMRQELEELYRKPNEELFNYLGYTLNW